MSLFSPLYDYRWAAGNGVALASLNNVENDIGAHNRRTATDGLMRVGVLSQPVDLYPVRRRLDSGTERGDGIVDHEWTMILCTLGLKYVLDTYLSSGATVSEAMTIYTRRHELASYARYNANLFLPSRRNGDLEYLRQNIFRVRFRFGDLTAL